MKWNENAFCAQTRIRIRIWIWICIWRWICIRIWLLHRQPQWPAAMGCRGGGGIRTCNRSCSSCGGFIVFIVLECSLNKHTALVVLAEGILVMSRSLQCSLGDISESRMYILYIYILDLKQQGSLASHVCFRFIVCLLPRCHRNNRSNRRFLYDFRNNLNYQCQSMWDILMHTDNTIQFCINILYIASIGMNEGDKNLLAYLLEGSCSFGFTKWSLLKYVPREENLAVKITLAILISHSS